MEMNDTGNSTTRLVNLDLTMSCDAEGGSKDKLNTP